MIKKLWHINTCILLHALLTVWGVYNAFNADIRSDMQFYVCIAILNGFILGFSISKKQCDSLLELKEEHINNLIAAHRKLKVDLSFARNQRDE